MKTIKIITLTALLFAFGNSVFAQNKQDEKALQNLVATIAEGWNTPDAQLMASVFAAEHSLIAPNGHTELSFTREANEAIHGQLLTGPYKGVTTEAEVQKIRFLSKDIAIVYALTKDLIPGPDGIKVPGEVVENSMVCQRTAGNWEIVSIQMTPIVEQPMNVKPDNK
jgi:uncharacterized protein (TIGR02246 family)